jgi:hypothetical protein
LKGVADGLVSVSWERIGGVGAAAPSVPNQGFGSPGSELTGHIQRHGTGNYQVRHARTLVLSHDSVCNPSRFWMTLSFRGLWLQMHRTWMLTLRGMGSKRPPTDSEDKGVPRSGLCIILTGGSRAESLCALRVAWSYHSTSRWPMKASALPGRCRGFQQKVPGPRGPEEPCAISVQGTRLVLRNGRGSPTPTKRGLPTLAEC